MPFAKRYSMNDILADAVAEAPQALFKRFDKAERSLPERDREEPHPIDPPCRPRFPKDKFRH
jgi:hypothetical protein